METVEQLLNELSTKTPGEIAEILKNEGIKGYQTSVCECPMAKYLKLKSGKNVDMMYTFCSVDNQKHIDLPTSVKSFVFKFDSYSDYSFLRA